MLLLSYIAYLSKRLAKWVTTTTTATTTTTTNGLQQIPVPRAAAAYGRQLKTEQNTFFTFQGFFVELWLLVVLTYVEFGKNYLKMGYLVEKTYV